MDPNIRQIITQTTYTEEEAKAKLEMMNNDPLQVIRDFLGIPGKKEGRKKKTINQEIFAQFRQKLDTKDYIDKNPINIEHVKENFQEERNKQL
jgi:hypothetical protein